MAGGDLISFTRPRILDVTSIKFQKTVNAGVAYTDYSANVIDNSAATQADLDALDTLANGDWGIIGGPVPFCGAAIDMDAANRNLIASVLSAEYWNGGAWVALTNLVDGTAAGGVTLTQDGQITWTMPAAGLWQPSTINGILAYWMRFTVSVLISANVDVEECDLLLPMLVGIDALADGDDALLMVESQTAVVTGTVVVEGVIYGSWRQ